MPKSLPCREPWSLWMRHFEPPEFQCSVHNMHLPSPLKAEFQCSVHNMHLPSPLKYYMQRDFLGELVQGGSGSVTVWGWNGSSGSGVRFWLFFWGGGSFRVSAQFNSLAARVGSGFSEKRLIRLTFWDTLWEQFGLSDQSALIDASLWRKPLLKPVQSLKHTTENSAEPTVMRTKWFKHIAI